MNKNIHIKEGDLVELIDAAFLSDKFKIGDLGTVMRINKNGDFYIDWLSFADRQNMLFFSERFKLVALKKDIDILPRDLTKTLNI